MEREEVFSITASAFLHVMVLFGASYVFYKSPHVQVGIENQSITVDISEFQTPESSLNQGEDIQKTEAPILPEPSEPVLAENHNEIKKVPEKKKHISSVENSEIKDSSIESEGSTGALVGAGKAAPNYFQNPPPKYPESARRAHQEGEVMLMVSVAADGSPNVVNVKASSGHDVLDVAAVKAVEHWRFTPATLGGIPVASQVEIPIRFELK